jgi:hypothetical protein
MQTAPSGAVSFSASTSDPAKLRSDQGDEVVQDLTILFVLELIGKLKPEFANIGKNWIRQKTLHDLGR